MKRLAFLVLIVQLTTIGLWAQGEYQKVTIASDHQNVTFLVDEVKYRGGATFFWLVGTQHTIRFESNDEGYQGDWVFSNTRYRFRSWNDPNQIVQFDAGRSQSFYVRPGLHLIRLDVAVEYRILLQFWNVEDPQADPPGCEGTPNGGPGVLFVDGACYDHNTEFWSEPKQLPLEAHPFPGWDFVGWGINHSDPSTFVHTVNVMGSMTLTAFFREGKHIQFLTEPRGLDLLIDRARITPPMNIPCKVNEKAPAGAAPGAEALCVGEYYWAIGSKHVIGAPSPQDENAGGPWLFESFSNGAENHSVYEVNTRPDEVVVARFVRGASVSFVTVPSGLKLDINGRDNHLAYNFVARPGDVFELSAPLEQVGPKGRKYVFSGWSNNGAADQEVVVPPDAVESGFRLTATYELLSQVNIDSVPPGVTADVDGMPCVTPCSIDRNSGTEVVVTVPERQEVNPAQRLDFASWSDGGPRTRTITVAGADPVNLTVTYNKMYKLDTGSKPAGGATFDLNPASADGFFIEGTRVYVMALMEDGFKFIRWHGDLDGTYNAGWVTLNGSRSVVAVLEEIPYVAPAGIRNAAGQTPEEVVAPGSIISIYGGMLAPALEIGPASPLAQTLAGVSVTTAGRILGLMFVSPEQINAVLHPDIPEGKHQVLISRVGELDVEGEIEVRRNAPGIFTRYFNELFYAMASHEDGTPITPDSPARRDETITVWGTGFGPYDKLVPYGFALPESPEYLLLDPAEIFFGELPVQAEFVGGAPGFVGTDMIRIKIDESIPAASTFEMKVRINGRESNTVLLPVE